MLTRVVDDRAGVVREIRAAGPLTARLAAPAPARPPWLTAALNVQTARRTSAVRPTAVVVGPHAAGPPDAVALLALHRRGPATAVTLLGAGPGPLPAGRPPSRLPARDDDAARLLAAGLAGLLDRLRGPWTLTLSGLPLGDPTVRHLAALLPGASLATSRSRRLVDDLDRVADVRRSRDPAALERVLPTVLGRLPAAQRPLLRAVARVHAAIGQLEVAEVPAVRGPAAVLLTLLDGGPAGADRWPWWGSSDIGGLRRELGSPAVALTAGAGITRLGRRGSALSPGTAAG